MICQVLGHYRVVSEIGRGGMGVVYRPRDEYLHRDSPIHGRTRDVHSASE